MKNVLVRDLDDSLVASFKEEARRRGTTLQAVLKQTLSDHRPTGPSKEDILRELDELRAKSSPVQPGWNSPDVIQEGRQELDKKFERIFNW